jgi:hypothetical protein
MADNEINQQIKRLESWVSYSKANQKESVPTSEHIAIEQALALAYIARELQKVNRPLTRVRT